MNNNYILGYTLLTVTACGAIGSLKFLAVGDMGGQPTWPYTNPIQLATAKRMAQVATEEQPQFILALGDNFYTTGVKNVEDPRFVESFEKIYTGTSLQVPWYLLAGNHDHYGNVSAEILYSKVSNRWNFPQLYYNLSFTIPGTANTLDIVMIDTVTLCGNTVFGVPAATPQGPADNLQAEIQWEWIEQQLLNSRAKYLLVAGHFPVYSVAEHGPTSCLIDRLLPMLYKYHVTAYLCGHDHNLQHLQTRSYNGVSMDFIVSGMASLVNPSTRNYFHVPAFSLKYFRAKPYDYGGLTLLQASSDLLRFVFIDSRGLELYQSFLYPRILPYV